MLLPFGFLVWLSVVATRIYKRAILISIGMSAFGSVILHVTSKYAAAISNGDRQSAGNLVLFQSIDPFRPWSGPAAKAVALFMDNTWIVFAYVLVLALATFYLNRLAEQRLENLDRGSATRQS